MSRPFAQTHRTDSVRAGIRKGALHAALRRGNAAAIEESMSAEDGPVDRELELQIIGQAALSAMYLEFWAAEKRYAAMEADALGRFSGPCAAPVSSGRCPHEVCTGKTCDADYDFGWDYGFSCAFCQEYARLANEYDGWERYAERLPGADGDAFNVDCPCFEAARRDLAAFLAPPVPAEVN